MRSEIAVMLAAVGILLVSMLAYRVTPGGAASHDKTGRGGSFFLGYWVRNWFYWIVQPITRASARMRLSPFIFNTVAVVLGVASMMFYSVGRLPSAGWAILLSGFADVMDGEVARRRNVANKAGAFLDSTLDRFSEFAAFIGLAVYFGSGFPALAVLVALGGSLLVSYTRARGEGLGVQCKGGLMQRAERIILLGIGSIVDPSLSQLFGHKQGFVLTIIVAAIAAGTTVTAIYRTVWLSRKLGAR